MIISDLEPTTQAIPGQGAFRYRRLLLIGARNVKFCIPLTETQMSVSGPEHYTIPSPPPGPAIIRCRPLATASLHTLRMGAWSQFPPAPREASTLTRSMALNSALQLAGLLLINTVIVLCQHTSPAPPSLEETSTEEDSSLLYSFSQFNVPVNRSGVNTTQDTGNAVSMALGNPEQFLVLQFASTVIVTNLQVRLR